MAGIVSTLRSAGDAALDTLGRTVTIQRVTESIDNLRGVTRESVATYSCRGLLVRYKRADREGTAVGDSSRTAYLSATDLAALGVRPQSTDRVVVGGSVWEVVEVMDYEPGASPVLHRVRVERLVRGDATSAEDPVLSTSDGISYSQTAHGLAVGDVVRQSGSDWVEAQGNGTDAGDRSALGRGIVSSVPDENTVVVVTETAQLNINLGLTIGVAFYLSQGSAGAVTTSKPTSGWVQELGYILPGSKTLWFPREGYFL